MKFVFATLAATASALPWEKEVACGFDSACGFDVVIDEATGCGFDNGLGVGLGSVIGIGGYNIYEDDNKGTNYNTGGSACAGCTACKAKGACDGCNKSCPQGSCGTGQQSSGCRNGSCGNGGTNGSNNDWCTASGADCDASPDMVCNGMACDQWCPNKAVQCILDCLPDDFSACAIKDQPGGFGPGSKARNMVLSCINKDCRDTGNRGSTLAQTIAKKLGRGWENGCCGCFCTFGCNNECAGNCSPCGCSSCTGSCSMNGATSVVIPPSNTAAAGDTSIDYDGVRPEYTQPEGWIVHENEIPEEWHDLYNPMGPVVTSDSMKTQLGLSKEAAFGRAPVFLHRPVEMAGGKGKGTFGRPGPAWDVQCGFDQKTQQWVDVKCGFDNNCGFDFECGFDAECGFDVVKNTKCGFDIAREAAGCGFDAKSNTWVNTQCGFDNNCGFDIKA